MRYLKIFVEQCKLSIMSAVIFRANFILMLIGSVRSGGFDKLLLRPINLLYQVNTGEVDISCLISALAPIAVLIAQLAALGTVISVGRVALYILFVLNGVVILSSFMLTLYTLAFVFIRVDGLNNIYYFIMDIADKPKEMFGREFAYGFLFIVPAIPLANAPASILLGKANFSESLIYLGIGMLFLLASWIALKAGLRRYTSASS